MCIFVSSLSLFLSHLQSLCSTATMQTVRAADTNEVDKLIFRESDNDRKVSYATLILPATMLTCHDLIEANIDL